MRLFPLLLFSLQTIVSGVHVYDTLTRRKVSAKEIILNAPRNYPLSKQYITRAPCEYASVSINRCQDNCQQHKSLRISDSAFYFLFCLSFIIIVVVFGVYTFPFTVLATA